MAGTESQGSISLRGIPNFYSVMFFVSFILLVCLPCGLLSSKVWLDSKEISLNGRIEALQADIGSLEQQIAAGKDGVKSLEDEASEIARAEQMFSKGSDQGSLWGPDTRWSEMGRARVEEIWRRRGVLQDDLRECRALLRQKTADLTIAQASEKRIVHFRTFVRDHRIALYATILVGAFATVVFALLWGAIVQARINAILGWWARRQ
jgi:cell division protein FtsB